MALEQLGDTMQGVVNGRAPQALALMSAWRIGLRKTADGAVDTSRALLDVSKAIQSNMRAGGTVQSARQIAQAFGVESLLPLLMKGPAAIQDLVRQFDRLHAAMDGQSIRQADEYAQNIAKFELSVESLKNSLGNALIPVLQPAIQLMTEWLVVPKNKQKIIDGVAGAVRWLSEEIKPSGRFPEVGGELDRQFPARAATRLRRLRTASGRRTAGRCRARWRQYAGASCQHRFRLYERPQAADAEAASRAQLAGRLSSPYGPSSGAVV